MWRAVQAVPRAIRQQWSSSIRPAPQSVYCDQDDPYGLKRASVVHRSCLPTRLDGCVVRWWKCDSEDGEDSRNDKAGSQQYWNLPNGHNKGALEAVGWGTAILLGLQLSQLYHLNATKNRRRSSCPISEDVCPLKWIQHVATTSSATSTSYVTGGKVLSGKQGRRSICGVEHQQESNQYDVHSGVHTDSENVENLDVESVVDVVYEVENLECELGFPTIYFPDGQATFKFSTRDDSRVEGEDKSEERNASEKESDLEGAVKDWVELTTRCTVMAHHQAAFSYLKTGVSSRAFLHWQQACHVGGSLVSTGDGAETVHSTVQGNEATGNVASAHYNLALCYELGKGTKVNLEMARNHYAIAAADAHPTAMYNLAIYCLDGRGGDRDVGMARALLEKAASLGLKEARTDLGILQGKGDSEALKTAARFYKEASEINDVAGKFYLGMCYANGWGVTRNEEKAVELYSSAAKNHHPGALHQLAHYTENGKGGLRSDKRKALDLYRRAFKAGHECSHEHARRIASILNEEKFKADIDEILATRNKGRLDISKSRSSPALQHATLSFYIRENLLDFGPSTDVGDQSSPSSILESTRSKIISRTSFITNDVKSMTGLPQPETESNPESSRYKRRASFLLGDGEFDAEPSEISPRTGEKSILHGVNLVGAFGDGPVRKAPLSEKLKVSGSFGKSSVKEDKTQIYLDLDLDEELKREMKLVLCS